ncbi:BQ2448_7931 [Microbotryum intermedium]|uniref:Eukaryotic translation initiation factor 3 subunit H n=1 Tax=Microbotryum intermedium TaxID=269621 RepID=A0A238FMB7_9BASI|nr:BQ2448_7931 [Microbotryum intermedium]
MAPKRLADIAAPAPEVVAEPVAEVKKESAKQRARIDKGLVETRVESVTVDGLTLMKIIKHAREAHQVIPAPQGTSNATVTFSPAVGQLLGIDSEGSLQVSNAFALPAGALGGSSSDSEGENRGLKAASKYSAAVLSRMVDLNADGSIVGFYTSTNNGQTLAIAGFVEALIGAQMSGGGVGSGLGKATPVGRAAATKTNLVPGQGAKNGKGIALVYDVASAAQGHVGLKAYRLSAAFVEAYRAGKFDTQSLIEHKLVPSNILEEVPVTVHSSTLMTAFLSTLVTPSSSSAKGTSQSTSVPLDPLSTYSQLSLPTSSSSTNPSPLTTPLTALLSALETHQAHLSTLSFQSRQLGRDRARLESNPVIARRRVENEQRAKEGLPPLPLLPEELALQEPSRLETMCALNAVQGAAKSLNQATGTGLVRSYGAKAGTVG